MEAQEGGIQAEAVRVNIDAWVAIKVFGSSSFSVLGGEAETVSDVKSLLPQFKKVRTRDIQFGYRLLLHDDDSEPILLLDKTMKHGDKQLEYDDKEKHIELPEIINLEHILTGNMVHVKYETERISKNFDVDTNFGFESTTNTSQKLLFESWLKGLHREIQSSEYQDQRSLHIYSDGSATFRGNRCMSASAGLLLFIPPLAIKRDNEDNEDNDVSLKNVWSLTVTNGGGIVGTPYDAELIAGLVASTIASILRKLGVDDGMHTSMFTDSRSLKRVILSGMKDEEKGGKVQESNEQEESLGVFAMNRKLMTNLLNTNIQNIQQKTTQCETGMENFKNRSSSSSSSSSCKVNVQWIHGHPERREVDRSMWNLNDVGIYLADEVARYPNMFTETSGRPYDDDVMKAAEDVDTGRFKIQSMQHMECPACDIIKYCVENNRV